MIGWMYVGMAVVNAVSCLAASSRGVVLFCGAMAMLCLVAARSEFKGGD